MAWLAATPKPPAGSRREKLGLGEKSSRAEKLKKEKITPAMPPNPAPHLLTWLIEIGLTASNGMSSVPISWGEINEWKKAAHIRLDPWEARLIRQLSVEYVGESRRAESETCPPPFRAKITQREIDLAEAALDRLFAGTKDGEA